MSSNKPLDVHATYPCDAHSQNTESTPVSNDDRSVSIATNATVLTIAGSDPSGGAGLQVDLKAFQQVGAYGMAAVTLVTVQNTQGVKRLQVLSPELVGQQIDAVLLDIPPRAIKTGALGNAEIVCEVSEAISDCDCPLIVDPVLVSKHGESLADDDVVAAYRDHLLPKATLITPNRFEVERLLDVQLDSLQDAADAAHRLQALGPKYVLVKAGEFDGTQHHMFASPEEVVGLELKKLDSNDTHGAGCALSATIAGRLALTIGQELEDEVVKQAVHFAVAAVHHAIEFAPKLGQGIGPVESRMLHIGS